MRRIFFSAVFLIAGCGDTTLGIDVSSSASSTAQLLVSVFDAHHALAEAQPIAIKGLPGRVLIDLPDQSQRVRVVLSTAETPPAFGGIGVDVLAHALTTAQLALSPDTVDGDGDGVPDSVDNCPDTVNPDQASEAGLGGDACVRAGDLAAADLDGVDLAGVDLGDESAGTFVAVGYGGRRARSLDDGITWIDDQAVGNDTDPMNHLRTVVWAYDQFFALGFHVMSSPDGKTWTDHGTSALDDFVSNVAVGGTTLVAVGGTGLRDTSMDGLVYTRHSIDGVGFQQHQALAYGGGRFVATNNTGVRTYATNGTDWTASTGGTQFPTSIVAYGQSIFIAIGSTNVLRSLDGGATFGLGATLSASPSGLVFAQGQFVAVADGYVFTSAHGVTWTEHIVAGITGGPIAYGHGTYLLVQPGGIRRSSDGISWSAPIPTGNTNAIDYIGFGTP